jgi:hypothetical protein
LRGTHDSTSRTPLWPSLLNLPLPRPPASTWAFIIDGPSVPCWFSVRGCGVDGVDLLSTDTTSLAFSGVVTRNPGGTGILNWVV